MKEYSSQAFAALVMFSIITKIIIVAVVVLVVVVWWQWPDFLSFLFNIIITI